MTEEEKKAIEYLKFKIKDFKEKYGAENTTKQIEIYKTVLNLVKKPQEEIEDLKWKNEIYVKSIKSHKREIEKKDEIIDEMAKYIDKITEEIAREKGVEDFEFCDNECANKDEYIDCIDCIDCIKQYFENKVEGSK